MDIEAYIPEPGARSCALPVAGLVREVDMEVLLRGGPGGLWG